MTIFISYPMYFDALRTNINSENQKVPFSGHYGLKTGISPQSGDHWLQAHTRNQRNSASDSQNT